MKLRDYQIEAVEAILSNDSGIVSAATGSGKTSIMAAALERLNCKQVVFVHKQDLVIQTAQRITDETNLKVGQLYQDQHDNFDDFDVIVSTWQSMSLILNSVPSDYFKAIHIDECHNLLAGEYMRVVSHFTGKRFGYTATWMGNGQDKLLSFFGKVIYDINLFDLIDAGYLSKMRFYIHTDDVANASKKQNIEYQMNKWRHINTICSGHKHTTKAIHYFHKIKEFANSPIPFQPVSYLEGHEERQEIYRKFNDVNSGVDHLFSSRILNEGVDLPICNTLVFHENVGGFRTFNQRLGRGLRKWHANPDIITDVIMFINSEDEYNMREVVRFVDKVRKHNESKGERGVKEYEQEDVEIVLLDRTEDFIAKMRERMNHIDFYPTYDEWLHATQKLGIKSRYDYQKLYHKDDRLYSSPKDYYPNEWTGWKRVFNPILSFEDFNRYVDELGITNRDDWHKVYKSIPGARSGIEYIYPNVDWSKYWRSKKYLSFTELKAKCREIGIKNSMDYIKRYREIERAPAKLYPFYDEWKGWKDFLDK